MDEASATQDRRIQTACLLVLAFFAAGWALYFLSDVLVPFVLALFFAIALGPLIHWQVATLRMPRSLAIVVSLLAGVALLLALGVLVSTSITEMSRNNEHYQDQVTTFLDGLDGRIPQEMIDSARDAFRAGLGSLLAGIASVLSDGVVVLIFLGFLLSGERHATEGSVWSQVDDRVRRYLVTKFVVSAITGVLVGSFLGLLGIDLALVFGLFAFLLNFIPNIGSIIASLLPLPVVVMSPDVSLATGVLAIAVPAALQFVIGNVLEPRLMGRSVDLHPVTILLALIFWGTLWGMVGALLAVPLTAVTRLLLDRFEPTRGVAAAMAGRLAGVESSP